MGEAIPPAAEPTVKQLGWDEIDKGLLDQCDAVIQALGFDPRLLPSLTVAGKNVEWTASSLSRDRHTSELQLSEVPLRHVYGVGIAFPEDLGAMKASPTERG